MWAKQPGFFFFGFVLLSFPFALVFLVSPPPEGVKYRPDHERLEHRLKLTLNGDWLHKHRTNEDCVDSVLYYNCLCEEPSRLPSCVGPWSTHSKVSLAPWWGKCSSQMKERVLILSLLLLFVAHFRNFFSQDRWHQPDWNISLTIRRDFKRTTRGSPEPLDLDSSLCSRSPQIITSFVVF